MGKTGGAHVDVQEEAEVAHRVAAGLVVERDLPLCE